MKEFIIEIITTYGMEAVILAILINILTGFIKLPIKQMASKLVDSSKVTRFIVFLPILLGFGITVLYYYIFNDVILIDNEFITLWIASTSLSLTFYAIFEKIFPSKKKIEEVTEIETTEKILNTINEFFQQLTTNTSKLSVENKNKKIVLRGGKGAQSETEDE